MEADITSPGSPFMVGIGASAGGLEAVSSFLGKLPRECCFPVLVMFHLDPGANALLSDVLAQTTALPVVDAKDGMLLQPGRVYALPGHSIVSFDGQTLHLRPAEKPEAQRSVIDQFFQALASAQGERAAVVVMSGAGNDGSLGLQAVARAGGLTMVQLPETAKQPSMPQSASDTGIADYVLPPEKLAEELLAHAREFDNEAFVGLTKSMVRDVAEALPKICDILLAATGHNFRHYKTTTIIRRTMRRIQILRICSVEQYLDRLANQKTEADRLFTELLINVTAFFRDPEAFESLSRLVLPQLFEGKGKDDQVRLWVPGCATGEEAYSLAILLSEQMDGRQSMPQVQVFATDIDEHALSVARRGIYGQDITAQVTPERLRRFFVKAGARYEISKSVREMVLFSSHNLINDPPFGRIDLVSCRNLLIYLGSHLQKKLIPLFHYAIRPAGYLFLGPSETLNTHRELFRPLDAKHRISQRLPTAIKSAALVSESPASPLVKPLNVPAATEVDAYLVMQRIILDEFAPKAVLVNDEGHIVSASGNLEKYLAVPSGAFHNSITRLVRDGLRVALRSALSEARRVRRKIVQPDLSLKVPEGVQRLSLTVQPMPQLGENSDLYLVVFQDEGPVLAAETSRAGPPSEAAAHLIEQLERELARTRQDLEKSVQDLEAANEELKSSNEELLSMNEELQAANEEQEAAKEQLQGANDALVQSNTDLENLLASTQIATLFLDDDGHVRRVTPAVDHIYNLLPSDVGRPLQHFTHKAADMPALPAAPSVHASNEPTEDEVQMQDGAWYLRRVLPYRRRDGTKEGMVVTFIDITERKHSEERLSYQLDVTRSLTENATTAIFMTDTQSRCTFVNASALKITGYTKDELVGQVLHDKIHHTKPDGSAYPVDQCPIDRTLPEGRETRDHEDVFVRKDGIFFPVVCNATVIRPADKVVGTVIEVRDVTEERRWIEALRESESRLRQTAAEAEAGRARLAAVISGMNQGVVLFDAEQNLVRMNDAALAMYGFADEAEMLASREKFTEIFEKRDRDGRPLPPSQWPSLRTRRGEEVTNVELQVRRRDTGVGFVGLFSGSVVRSPTGEVQFSVLSINDVTERVRAEEAVKASEQRYKLREQELRTLADNTPDILTRYDRRLRHVFVNIAAERAMGYSREDLIGKTNRDLGMPADICDAWEAKLKEVFETGASQSLEFSFDTPHGKRYFAGRFVPEFGAAGEVEHALGVIHDKTAEKVAEDSLHEEGRRKDEFLATLAHELRNPLAPIRTGLQVLKLSAASDNAANKIQAMMERQLSHMVRLVDDLLDVSRISRGKMELKRERVNLASVLENAIEASRPLVEASRHELVVRVPSEPLWVDIDPTRIAQAVGNLLNNAAKYTPDRGKIQVCAERDTTSIVVWVKDNGSGIPEEMLPELFDMFTQVGRTLDRAQGGLGIGLSLVKRLVEMHGGSVSVQSPGPSLGSTFTIRLPLAESVVQPGQVDGSNEGASATTPKARRVLVVDDNVDAAESLAMVLEMTGHEIRTAHSGPQALSLTADFIPEVVFLDIGLPGMDGHEVARQIRLDPRLQNAKLVALTGWGSDEDKRRSREAGFDHHLTKPVEASAVQRILESMEPSS